jgi:hypothetical protein
MLKKVLMGVGILVVVLGGFAAYTVTRPRVSPPAKAEINADGLDIKVAYSAPMKKGRVIFGDKEQKAVVPYGEYWRLGANEATEITFSKNVSFGGKAIPAGTYRMYTVPTATQWKLVLNSVLGKWGAWDADHDKDIASIDVPVEKAPAEQESLLISFSKEPLKMDIVWDTTAVHVPIAAN